MRARCPGQTTAPRRGPTQRGFGTDGGADTDGGFGTGSADTGDAGKVTPKCLDWGAHAEARGFGSDAADYCALDLEIGALTSPE